jgi:hypothetical protein
MPSFSKWHAEAIKLGYEDSRTPAARTLLVNIEAGPPVPTAQAPNGSTFSRKPREPTVAKWERHRARIGGCNVLLARL